MKKLIKLSALGIMMFGLATSCDEIESLFPDKELAAPNDLTALNVTATSADLSWAGVPGAEYYNINLNDGTMMTAGTNTFRAADLTPSTEYSWAVQAVRGDHASPWSVRETFTTGTLIQPLDAPANLVTTDITVASAILHWDEVAEAIGYEVMFGDETFSVATPVYAVTGLTSLTTYTWTVRALAVDRASDWAAPVTFTTPDMPPAVAFWEAIAGSYYGAWYGSGTSNFEFWFHDFYFGGDEPDFGVELYLDFISVAVDDSPEVEFLTLPEGTYTFDNSAGANSIYIDGGTSFLEIENSAVLRPLTITGGFMTIAGNMDNYHMEFEVWVEEYSYPLRYVWDGPLMFANPNYEPPVEDVHLGELTNILQYMYEVDPFGGAPAVEAWLISAGEDGTWIDEEAAVYMGTGWIVAGIQPHQAIGNGEIIPDGDYPIDSTNEPGTCFWNLNFLLMDNDIGMARYYMDYGNVNITYDAEADEYTFVVDGYDYRGANYTATVRGKEVTGTAGVRAKVSTGYVPVATWMKDARSGIVPRPQVKGYTKPIVK